METMQKMGFILTIKIKSSKNPESREKPAYFVEVTKGRVTDPMIQNMVISLRSSPDMVRELVRQQKAVYQRYISEVLSRADSSHRIELYQYCGEL